MSASKKLKRFAVANDPEADHWDRVTSSARIREALPQIVALTEAAEVIDFGFAAGLVGSSGNDRFLLRDALAALEEALA